MLKNDLYYKYKYKKYKIKYLKIKYLNILSGGNYKINDDPIYKIIQVIDDKLDNIKIEIDPSILDIINTINKTIIITSIINIFKINNKFILKLENLQLLILCIVCSIITSPKLIINTVINFIDNIINNQTNLIINLFKTTIPCSEPAFNLLEQIINEIIIHFNPENDKIDLTPLKILLPLFNLFLSQPNSNTIKIFQKLLKPFKIYAKDFKDLNIENTKKIYINFTTSLEEKLINFNNDFNKFKTDLQTSLVNTTNEINKHLVNTTNKINKILFSLFKGGGNILQTQFIIIKDIELFDLLIQFLKTIIDKELLNIIFVSLRLLIKLFKDNTFLLFQLNDEISTIFNIWYNTIDSILCFLLLVNNFTQALINTLKIIIHDYFGPELSGFSSIICNFIQSIFDTFINQKCIPNIITVKNSDIIKKHKNYK